MVKIICKKNLKFMDYVRWKKMDIFVFGYMSKPNYCIDYHRSRICRMLSNDFNFSSLDDGLFPKNVDIFHSKPWNKALWSFRSFKMRNWKIKHICTFYGLPLEKNIGKKFVKSADVVTLVGLTTMKESLHEFGDADYRVIYDAIDTNFYKPVKIEKSDRLRILMVITSARNLKNHRTFIQIARSFPKVDFVLRTFSNIDKSSLPDNVIIDNTKYPISNEFGESKGLRDLYNSADIYLFPSIHEGLNNTTLEAMACNLPIVAFDITSMPELVKHNENGFLCNNFRDMESNLEYLIENEDDRIKMGRKSREIAKWFTWEKCAEGFKKVYQELL